MHMKRGKIVHLLDVEVSVDGTWQRSGYIHIYIYLNVLAITRNRLVERAIANRNICYTSYYGDTKATVKFI